MESFVTRAWYAAAWAEEIATRPLARMILGEPVLLFRPEPGKVTAMLDRCPHRLAPLSFGSLEDGQWRCAYHGLKFNIDGVCTHVPGQQVIPGNARVRVFPTLERYDLIWIWMGEPDRADPALLPRLAKYGNPEWGVEHGYQHHPANYRIIIENLLDPAHVTFLHRQTIANPLAAEHPVTVKKGDDHIVAFRWLENSKPSPMDRAVRDWGDAAVDRGQFFYFYPPCTSRVDISTLPAGTEHSDAAMDAHPRTLSYKFLTPETERTTHFFWLHTRNHKLGDAAFAQKLHAGLEHTYQEDREICGAIQIEQERTGRRQYTAIAIDAAPKLAMATLSRMIEAEDKIAPQEI